jgi:aspartokinase/homoserine dehydrogenase 1
MLQLGRGGSDYTAAILLSVNADPLEIWTDVNGMFTANPKIKTSTTHRIYFISGSNGIVAFGAKVLSTTIQPFLKAAIPIWIKNTFEPKREHYLNNPDANANPIKEFHIDTIALLTR